MARNKNVHFLYIHQAYLVACNECYLDFLLHQFIFLLNYPCVCNSCRSLLFLNLLFNTMKNKHYIKRKKSALRHYIGVDKRHLIWTKESFLCWVPKKREKGNKRIHSVAEIPNISTSAVPGDFLSPHCGDIWLECLSNNKEGWLRGSINYMLTLH